ncbi:MAG TPA: DUF2914 domain-containing protein [Crenotrichaceae bacterium]|nr:DUF2914 domain-containing protein [Crenotrichaceae bacterium]
MAEKKIRFEVNPDPTHPDSIEKYDYEIKPEMIEVWDGKRIAWAIAILSTLILIPVIYLLLDSYWGNDANDLQNQLQTQAKSNESSITTERIKPGSPVAASPVTTDRELNLNVEQAIVAPAKQSQSDIQTTQNDLDVLISKVNQRQSNPIPAATRQAITESTIAQTEVRMTKLEQTLPVADQQSAVPTSQSEKTGSDSAPVATKSTTTLSQDIQTPAITQPRKSKHVSRAMVVTNVIKREPVGENIETVQINKDADTRLFYFTEVNGLAGQVITYRWLYEGILIFSKNISVTGNKTWRSYINKHIPRSMTGRWSVELLDSKGNLLAVNHFNVL